MDKIWRLLTAIFLIAVAVGLFLIGWIFSNGTFNNIFSALIIYVVLFLVLIGITKGILVIIDYHREQDQEKEE